MAADNVMKLGFILSATDKMSRIVDDAVKKSTDRLNAFERRTAAIGKGFMKVGGIMTATGVAFAGSMFTAAKNVAAYGDKIDAAAQKTGMGVEDLQRFAYAAERNNVSFESFTSAVGKLNKKVIDLQASGKKGGNVFTDLGIKMGEPRDMLLQLSRIFAQTQDGAAKTALAMEIFGKSGADLIPFLNEGEAGIAALSAEAERMGLVLSADAIKQADNFDTKLNDLKSTMRGAGLQIGSLLIPAVQSVVEKVKEVIEKITVWAKANPDLVEKIVKVVTALTGFLLVAGPVVTMFGAFISVIGKLKYLIGAAKVVWFGFNAIVKFSKLVFLEAKTGMLLFRLQYIALIVQQKASAAAQWLWNSAAGAGKAVAGVFSGAIGKLSTAVKFTGLLFKSAALGIKGFYASVKTGAIITKVVAAAQGIWNVALMVFQAIPIIAIITAIVVAVALLIYGIVKLIKNWDKVKEAIILFAQAVKAKLMIFFNWIGEKFTAVWAGIKSFFSGLWESIKNMFRSVWEWIKNMFLNYTPHGLIIKHWDKITDWFSNLWTTIKETTVERWNAIIDAIKGAFSSIGEWFAGLKDSFFEWGKSIIQGLIDGVMAMFTKVKDAIGNVGNLIKDKFKGVLGIKSPSTIFAEYGLNITQGLTGGLETGEARVERATEGLAMQTMRAAGESITAGSTNVTNSMSESNLGGATLNYAPVINIQGGGGSAGADILRALQQHKGETLN